MVGAGAGAGPLWGAVEGGSVGCRGDVGRVVRRLLYERDASRLGAELAWQLFEGVGAVVGAEAGGQGAGDDGAGAGGRGGEAGAQVGQAAGRRQLPVLRTDGGGCVPRVGTEGWR